MRTLVVVTVIFLGLSFFRESASAKIVFPKEEPTNEIVLTKTGLVEVISSLGELVCKQGSVSLESPVLRFPNGKEDPRNKTVINNYGSATENTTVIGPYSAGTRLVFSIQPRGIPCFGKYWKSNNPLHAKIVRMNSCFKITWEDYSDQDFNDLYLYICEKSDQVILSSKITGRSVYNDKPRYALPWKTGESHKVSQAPSLGYHYDENAYDFSGQFDVYAPEKAQVLWAEDSFGSGDCDGSLRGRTNVLVLQTSPDTQVTLVHLAQGSISSLGINIGDVVQKGQLVGKSGDSGFSCGVHLHMEWQKSCRTIDDNLKVWDKIVARTRSRTRLDWSCPTKAFYSDGFWIGNAYANILNSGVAYTNK